MKKNNLITIALMIITGIAGFVIGMKYKESKMPEFLRNTPANFNGRNAQFGQRGGNGGIRPVSGEIIDTGENNVTVKLDDNTSKIIILTDESSIKKTEDGTKDDLSEGSKVTVFGEENSDGSITAQNIQIGSGVYRELE